MSPSITLETIPVLNPLEITYFSQSYIPSMEEITFVDTETDVGAGVGVGVVGIAVAIAFATAVATAFQHLS